MIKQIYNRTKWRRTLQLWVAIPSSTISKPNQDIKVKHHL